jgi:quercetin dioxygenase-like cupin family protein
MADAQEPEIKQEFMSQVYAVENLIEYQKNSVVSKTIIKKNTGTITLFAFDEGERLSEHTAPFDALVHVLDGEAEIIISGKPYTVKQHEMIIMPAEAPHAVLAITKFKMMLIMIKS